MTAVQGPLSLAWLESVEVGPMSGGPRTVADEVYSRHASLAHLAVCSGSV